MKLRPTAPWSAPAPRPTSAGPAATPGGTWPQDDWAPYPAAVYRAAGSHAGSFSPAGVDMAGDAWDGDASAGSPRDWCPPTRPRGPARGSTRAPRRPGTSGLERPRGGHHRAAGKPRRARPLRPLVGHVRACLPRTLVPFKLPAPPADKRDAMPRTSKELLNLALDLLPEMPGTVEVYAQDGGVFNLMLAAIEGDMIYAYGDRNHVRDGLTLTWQQRNQEGDGHNVRFTIQRTFFQSGAELLLHLYVSSIEDHFASRTAPRAQVSVPAYLHGALRPRDRAGRAARHPAGRRLAHRRLLHHQPQPSSPATRSRSRPSCRTGWCGWRPAWSRRSPPSTAATASAARSPTCSRPTATGSASWPASPRSRAPRTTAGRTWPSGSRQRATRRPPRTSRSAPPRRYPFA